MDTKTKESINDLIDQTLNQYEKTGVVPHIESVYKSVVKEDELNISTLPSSELAKGKVTEFKPSFIK